MTHCEPKSIHQNGIVWKQSSSSIKPFLCLCVMRHKYWHIAFLLKNLMNHDNVNSWADILKKHSAKNARGYRAHLNEIKLIWLNHQKSENEWKQRWKKRTLRNPFGIDQHKRSLTLSKLKLITDHTVLITQNTLRQSASHELLKVVHRLRLRRWFTWMCLFSSFVWIRSWKGDRRWRGPGRREKSQK